MRIRAFFSKMCYNNLQEEGDNMSKKNLPKEVSKENPKKIEKNAENLPKDFRGNKKI